MADDTFGGVVIDRPEPDVIVVINQGGHGGGQSGFSGYSGSGGSSENPGASGYSGRSGFSGPRGLSGFSGYSSSSGYSGYSGLGPSGFSGYSGASGISGPGGGNSGYSGYSGLDGTFSASGYSGYSGFSSRSGFSGFSGSGVSGYSGYSGYSGQTVSGFSGFSGFGQSGFSGFSSQSGFSGFSGKSGYSGGPSGFSGFSGTGSPPGGTTGNFQYNDGAGGYAGSPYLNADVAANTFATNTRFFFQDVTDPTKTVRFDTAPIPSGGNVIIRVQGTSTTVIANPATSNNFVTGIGASGDVTKAQPTFSNLAGLATYGQMDRSTTVLAETNIITIAANTKVKSQASGTLTTIAFSGGDNQQQGRRLDLDVTGGPYTLSIPTSRRIGETGTVNSIAISAGYHEFSWEYINGEYVLSDSVPGTTTGTGTSGYSGYSGRSGYSAYSGFSGATGAGSSGFSGFSGPGSSGFSGYSAPNLLTFSTHNDTDYTLILADANTGIIMASSAAHNLTVPTNASVPFALGTQIPIEQGGTGVVSVVPAAGVTLQGASTTSGQYSCVVLIKQASNTWLVAKTGTSGYSGYSGGAGSAGSSGFSGYSGGGPSGFSGYSGPGSSGFSGYSSFSGFSGKSGYSGYSAPQLLTFSTQTDTDYTLVAGDANTGVKMSSSSAHNLTVPPNSSVAFAIGTQIPVEQAGTGIVSIVAGAGVTLQGAAATSGQYSLVVLIKQATDTWLVGNGNSGYSGYSGSSGISGYSGYSGFSAFSGFSGTGGWTKFTVTGSDVTTTGQTLVDITGLVSGTLSNSTLYSIRAELYIGTSNVVTGTQYGIHLGGTGAAGVVSSLFTSTTTALATNGCTVNAADTATSIVCLTASNINGVAEFRGFVTTRSTGTATISIQHLKVTSGTSTVKIGSWMEIRPA